MCGQELEQMSSVDQGSQYSLSDGILPSLGAASRNHRRPKLRRFIISPFNPHYKSVSLSLSLCFRIPASEFCTSICFLKWVDEFSLFLGFEIAGFGSRFSYCWCSTRHGCVPLNLGSWTVQKGLWLLLIMLSMPFLALILS